MRCKGSIHRGRRIPIRNDDPAFGGDSVSRPRAPMSLSIDASNAARPPTAAIVDDVRVDGSAAMGESKLLDSSVEALAASRGGGSFGV